MPKFRATLFAIAVTSAFASSQALAQGKTGLPDALNVNVTNTPLPVTTTSDTVVLVDQTLQVNSLSFGNHRIGPINTTEYKSIRINVTRDSCSPCADPVNVLITTDNQAMDFFLLNTTDGGVFASRVYEVPGISVSIAAKNPSPDANNFVHVFVFGRK